MKKQDEEIISLMAEAIKELREYTNKKDIEKEIDDITINLSTYTPKEIAHKFGIPLSPIQKIKIVIDSQLSKADEVSLTFFLKKVNFIYENYGYEDPREMFYVVSSKLQRMSIEKVIEEENLSLEIVKKIESLMLKE